MDDPRVNLLAQHYTLKQNRQPSPWLFGRYFFGTILGGAMVGIGISYAATHWIRPSSTASTEPHGFFARVAHFVASGERQLQGEADDRVNVALLGIGGAGHEGPELTDTLLLASLRPSDGRASLLSIPRDLLAPIPNHGWWKINHANAFGEQENKGGGPAVTAAVLQDILEQPIPYTVKVDFSGFEKFIDALGGVDVFVERAFTDAQYPTEDFLVRTVQFQTGWQHMNGERALVYARSRHGNNGEGSDFARAKRQQKLLVAARDRALSAGVLLNPIKLHELFTLLDAHVSTNISLWELTRFATLASTVNASDVKHATLSIGNGAPLMESTLNGAYVLLPAQNDWAPVRAIAKNLLSEAPVNGSFTPAAAPARQVRVRIENGTEINGLAFRTSQWLEGRGFTVVGVGNASNRTAVRTTIYDVSGGKFSKEAELLKGILQADVSGELPSAWTADTPIDTRVATLTSEGERTGSDTPTDVLIILGRNASDLVLATP